MAWLAHQRLGYNYRLTEIAAAIGVVQCERLDEILDNRRRVAHCYMDRLMTNRYLILPTIRTTMHMSWFVFVVRLNDLFEPGDRDEVMQRPARPTASAATTTSRRSTSSRTWPSSSATSPATSRSANTSPAGRSRCRSSRG